MQICTLKRKKKSNFGEVKVPFKPHGLLENWKKTFEVATQERKYLSPSGYRTRSFLNESGSVLTHEVLYDLIPHGMHYHYAKHVSRFEEQGDVFVVVHAGKDMIADDVSKYTDIGINSVKISASAD